MSIYRQIYEASFGPIPKDETGRSHEIHHIDGNHENNDISNLMCVSIQAHYDIHYVQGDYGACHAMAVRMKSSPSELSHMASLENVQRVKNGTHNFLGPEINQRRIDNGTHHFLGGEIARQTARKRIADGTHNFLNQPIDTCPRCGKIGKRPQMKQWHFDKCKFMSLSS